MRDKKPPEITGEQCKGNILVKRLLIYFLVSGCLTLNVEAQELLSLKLDGTEQGKTLDAFFEEVEAKADVRFYFLPEWIASIEIQKHYPDLDAMLKDLFKGTGLSYFTMYADALVIVKNPRQALLRNYAIDRAQRQQKKIKRYTFGTAGKSTLGEVLIKGRVLDANTGEPLPQTYIQVSDGNAPIISNENGAYEIRLAAGVHVITFSFVDYEDQVVDLIAYDNGEINIDLEEIPRLLNEVVVRDQAFVDVANSKIGQTRLTIREMKFAPPFLGEVDLVKQVQTLPGVTTVGEAATGFNVRGGSVDQNLILYDGMPVFNSSHVFGFLSAFNPESVRDVSFYKGGIPAEYGGRVSSVLDIRSKDGSFDKWGGNVGLGMITSNVMVNGPLQKDKTAIAASFRSTYSNWLVHTIRSNYADLSKSSVSFYDGTIKLTHVIDANSRLSFTGYASKDGFRLSGDSTYQWKNLQASLRLDHQFSENLNGEFILGVSNYGYAVINDDALTASKLSYQITSTAFKAGFSYRREQHKFNFGGQLLHYYFDPGTLIPGSAQSNARRLSIDNQYSIESAIYFADDWSLTERLSVEGGLRLPVFLSFGPSQINRYQSGLPLDISTVTDTLNYGKGQVSKAYFGVEPRLSVKWMTSPTSSIKLGYNRIYQFLQLVTNTTAVTPVDIWQPSGYYFKPQRADQVSLGFFTDFHEKKYGASVEGFYKLLNNVLEFKDGAQLILNPHLETELLQGKGHAYGIETSITKNSGRLTGSLNYTYARTFRRIAGPTSSESVNRGQQYPASFDQPHIVNLSWKYNLSKRYFFTGNFTFHTGRPVTIPLSAFQFENATVAYFSGRNQYRIGNYHRLDLALVMEGNHKKRKIGSGTWVLAVYNVYARKNPYSVFFRSSGSGLPTPYQLSIVGTIFPSLSYNLKF